MALIQFTNVNLEYPIREHQAVTLKEFILRGLLFKREKRIRTIRALSDLTFDIHDEERIGVVGLNGAGKSSLLKTIAGVYPIQTGTRQVEGSICSLFDINLGFEPDATGWQNIYYRSYLQGETPKSIKSKLQEIGDFTELGHFLDLPIRCYSAGMVMRLAFAIATARRPEILLIDEVLATGDLPFQKKAYERMSHFLHQARIVVVVSHNLDFLQAFCSRAIWLHQGKVHALGPVRSVIQAFQDESGQLPRVA
jgi:ABC-type polysaccharide/polyol phosphate transport system ATPase subunit